VTIDPENEEFHSFIALTLLNKDLCEIQIKRYNASFFCLIGLQLLKRLEDLHKIGIIHNDVKPDNVMISSSQKMCLPRVTLIDLGLSKINSKKH